MLKLNVKMVNDMFMSVNDNRRFDETNSLKNGLNGNRFCVTKIKESAPNSQQICQINGFKRRPFSTQQEHGHQNTLNTLNKLPLLLTFGRTNSAFDDMLCSNSGLCLYVEEIHNF